MNNYPKTERAHCTDGLQHVGSYWTSHRFVPNSKSLIGHFKWTAIARATMWLPVWHSVICQCNYLPGFCPLGPDDQWQVQVEPIGFFFALSRPTLTSTPFRSRLQFPGFVPASFLNYVPFIFFPATWSLEENLEFDLRPLCPNLCVE